MIPTSYTNTTFADYLRDEVMLDTAEELGWLDIDYFPDWAVRLTDYPATGIYDAWTDDFGGTHNTLNRLYGDGYVVLTATGSGTATRGISPSTYFIPSGTKMTFTASTGISTGANRYTTVGDVAVGATSITFTGTNAVSAGQYGWFYNNTLLMRVINPVYQSIIDSTLGLLGISDITSVTGAENIKKLRLYGRREAWKFAMQTLAADYSYSTGINSMSRYDVYLHCKDVWIMEDVRLRNMYGEAGAQALKESQYIVNTTHSKAKVRW